MAESDPRNPPPRSTVREREAELDARSSGLDTRTDIDAVEALAIIKRVAGYIALFPGRYTIKFILKLGSYSLPLALLPWPGKVLIDHVILQKPLEDAAGYPFYIWPFINALQGSSAVELLLWLALIASR